MLLPFPILHPHIALIVVKVQESQSRQEIAYGEKELLKYSLYDEICFTPLGLDLIIRGPSENDEDV